MVSNASRRLRECWAASESPKQRASMQRKCWAALFEVICVGLEVSCGGFDTVLRSIRCRKSRLAPAPAAVVWLRGSRAHTGVLPSLRVKSAGCAITSDYASVVGSPSRMASGFIGNASRDAATFRFNDEEMTITVSYTHLTLP